MKIKRSFTVKAVLWGILGLSSFVCISLWNKADFCGGWAAHYAQRAAMLRDEQSLAIAENRPDDAQAIEHTVLEMDVIAKKYARVANNPLLAYPSKPLVTDAELAFMRDATDG
ncbi:hypothetical protein [Neorhodopirellula pilleata]|uniref:Uncharacterized protein n=1 Tax=Neorhodopirellula pilleata TaxID=2714738 RepID=A0A5C6ARJ0_9BACT|nr:hypothetical protein [Neorhodopirellula pilleata]TWU01686.1 hypothetical protein Pla100_14210 [Neorhodopirellula pilleata]